MIEDSFENRLKEALLALSEDNNPVPGIRKGSNKGAKTGVTKSSVTGSIRNKEEDDGDED